MTTEDALMDGPAVLSSDNAEEHKNNVRVIIMCTRTTAVQVIFLT